MVSICRHICYIIYWLVLPYRQCHFTLLCSFIFKIEVVISKFNFYYNITQKSICTGFGLSTIVNANTTAWHLLQINPFTTKVSAAKHIYILNLRICYPKIINKTIFLQFYIPNYVCNCNAYILQKMTIESI